MKYPRLAGLLLLAVLTLHITACKKKGISDPLGSTQIVTINYTNSGGDLYHYRIVYGAGGNTDSIISTGGGIDTGNNAYVAFAYLNSSYTVTSNGISFSQVDINASLNIDSIFNGANTTYILYNGTQASAIYEESPSSGTLVYNYNYNNGDITAVNNTGTAITYDYDESRSGQLGDPLQIGEFLNYGRAYTKSTHLVKDMYINGTLQQTYTYQTDGQGRLTQTTIISYTVGANVDTERYAYGYNY